MSLPANLLLSDVAATLGVSVQTARRAVDKAGMGSERDSSGRRVISADDLTRLIAARGAK